MDRTEPSADGGARRGLAHWRGSRLTLAPAFVWWAVFLVTPIVLILVSSFFRRGPFGGVVYELTLANFVRAFDPLYLGVLWYSVQIAFITTVICFLIGFPAAYFIATRPNPRVRAALLVLVVLPFLTNFLIRTYAWIVLLNREGVVNQSLRGMGPVVSLANPVERTRDEDRDVGNVADPTYAKSLHLE